MKPRIAITAIFFATAGLAAAPGDSTGFNLLPLALQKDPQIPMNVITEVTPDGKNVTPATPAKPVYYVCQDGGMVQGGGIVAGERPPAIDTLEAAMVKALAVNGYLSANSAHRPALFIYYRWGSFNAFARGSHAPKEARQANAIQRASIIGGDAFAAKVSEVIYSNNPNHVWEKEYQANLALLNARYLYFLIATAYEVDANQHHETLLWTTKMCTPSEGVTMAEAIPVLLANAAPYFGREMTVAQPLKVHLRQGEVTAGPATVKGYIAPDATPQK